MKYTLNRNRDLPVIFFDNQAGVLLLEGASYSDDAQPFYQGIANEIRRHSNDLSELTLVYDLDYWNSHSSKCLAQLFTSLSSMPIPIQVKWHYDIDDPDKLEFGRILQEITALNFHFIPNH